MMTSHSLKIWPTFFEDVASGVMPFTVRRADRDFQEGDTLVLHEFDPAGDGAYSGLLVRKRVSFVGRNIQGVEPGYVVLGLAALPVDA